MTYEYLNQQAAVSSNQQPIAGYHCISMNQCIMYETREHGPSIEQLPSHAIRWQCDVAQPILEYSYVLIFIRFFFWVHARNCAAHIKIDVLNDHQIGGIEQNSKLDTFENVKIIHLLRCSVHH